MQEDKIFGTEPQRTHFMSFLSLYNSFYRLITNTINHAVCFCTPDTHSAKRLFLGKRRVISDPTDLPQLLMISVYTSYIVISSMNSLFLSIQGP